MKLQTSRFKQIAEDAYTNIQILSIVVLLMWLMVSVLTWKGVLSGDIFVAPCLKDLPQKQQRNEEDSSRD